MKVIDTLSEGFSAANRRPWIVAIPMLVDLLLWLGPKVTIGPHLAGSLESGLPQQYSGYGALIRQTVSGFNLLSLLAVVYLPSLVTRLDHPAAVGLVSNLAINSAGRLLLLAALTLLAGLWLSCLYLGLVAQVVRDGTTNARVMAVLVWRYWRRLIGFLALLILLLGLAAIPIGLIYTILASLSPTAGEFVAFIVQIALIWALVYLFFAVQALMLSDARPMRAIRLSVTVIANNFWAALALIGLTFLITLGLPLAWQVIAATPAGVVAGIVGNAYIATGVTAAAFLFYKERVERLNATATAHTPQEAR